MKLLITGGKGMLGRTLQQEFCDWDIVVADLPEIDITNAEQFDDFLRQQCPDAVIHAAAMTAVDNCESDREKAFLLNEQGSVNVACSCQKHGVRLLAISTDYVFDGKSSKPYCEQDVPTGGSTVYGQSKLAGENAVRRICADHLIVRISWLYGAGGPSFVHTMMRLAGNPAGELKVVNDQFGNPTSALAVARKLRELLLHPELRGVVHVTCEGSASWYEFAREIFLQAGVAPQLTACSTAEFPRPAPRPKNSRLLKEQLRKWKLAPMPHWREALKEFMSSEFPRQ